MSEPNVDDRLREYSALVREVRHDMNGPLTSVLGNVQLLLDDPAISDEETRETLRDIETELRRIALMIRRLSEVQSPDDG